MAGDASSESTRESTRRLPLDLIAVVGFTVITCLLVFFVPALDTTVFGVVFGIPFVLLAPGYAITAILFPEANGRATGDQSNYDGNAERTSSRTARRIDGFERLVLSIGTSIAVVPLLSLLLNFTPLGVRLAPVVLSIGGVTIVCAVIGAIRRRRLPPEDRFVVPYRRWLRSARSVAFGPGPWSDRIATIAVALAVVLTVSSVAYTAAVPRGGETITEFYVLTQSEDGDLVAADYPTEFTRGEREQLYVGITNREHRPVNYTVIVALQRVRTSDDSARVMNERELHRFDARLTQNESWRRQHTIAPRMTGERLRLVYLLYRGEPPADPTVENAYREVHIWINVSNQA